MQQLGERFEIEAEAGVGGMGTVYRAHDRETGERVALKVLRSWVNANSARFVREAQVLAKLRHPSVVRYVSHGTTGDAEAFLAMEWLEGQDLRQRLADPGLTIAETVTVGLRVAEALAAVHALGVLHRDIKPANIFLVGGVVSEVKLIDFGLVRTGEEVSQSLTRTGTAMGTPGYMAPEQARGQRDADERADLFSLGCVLFKCLTGRAPFEGRHVVAVLTKVLLEDPPAVKSLRPEVPDALDALVARLLRKDPAQRHQTAGAVAEALRAILAEEATRDLGDREPAPLSRTFSGITDLEQRVAAVLLFSLPAAPPPRGPAAPPPRDAPTLPAGGIMLAEGEAEIDDPSVGVAAEDAIEAVARRFGGRLEPLADGTRLIAIAEPLGATDQAARTARCALGLRALLPGVPMALAMGWSGTSGQALGGEAIDRGAKLLERETAAAAAGRASAGVAVDEVTAALLGAEFELVAGDGEFVLLGLRDTEIGARTLLGKATPCVGREWELSTVASLFAECVDEPAARAVVFTAAPGMGKSRLAAEAVAALRRASAELSVWVGRGDATRAGSAFGLLGQVIRAACGLRDADSVDQRRRLLAERVAERAPAGEVDRIAQFLGEIVGVPFPDELCPALRAARADAQLLGEQTRRAWVDFITAEVRARPVLLVLEDLHWSDAATVRFIDAALSHLEDAPLMVLAFGRPELDERFPKLWAGRSVQPIRLKPLSRRAAERLARHVLGDQVSAASITRVVELAEGNVFFLEELIRAVVADRSRGRSERGPLPETVLAVVQARIDALDPSVRRVLRAASVFGETFWPGGIAALLLATSAPSGEWVDLLIAGELVIRRVESRFPGEIELAFRHALIREGAYARLTEADRTLGHRLAGEWLEQHGEQDPMVLAHHFERGGDAARAAGHYLRAAERALGAGDLAVAVERAEQAIAAGLPEAARIEALSLVCEAKTWQNDWTPAAETADKVMKASRPGSAPWARAVAAKQGHALVLGKMDEFVATLGAVWGAEPEPDAVGAVLYALHSGMFILCLGNRFMVAEQLLGRIEQLAARVTAREPATVARVLMCRQVVDALGSGDPERALRRAEEARAIYAAAGDPAHVAWAQLFVGIDCWALGALDRARREMAEVAAGGPRATLALSARDVYEGLLLIDAGALDDARMVADRAAAAGDAWRSVAAAKMGEARWLRAEIALVTGDLEGAEREARGALELLTYPMGRLAVEVTRAAILLAAGRGAEALAAVRGPLGSVEAQGGRGFRAARTRLVAAEAMAAAGDREGGRALLAIARSALLGRAERIVDPGLRRGFLEDVPENVRTLALALEWEI